MNTGNLYHHGHAENPEYSNGILTCRKFINCFYIASRFTILIQFRPSGPIYSDINSKNQNNYTSVIFERQLVIGIRNYKSTLDQKLILCTTAHKSLTQFSSPLTVYSMSILNVRNSTASALSTSVVLKTSSRTMYNYKFKAISKY